METSGKRRLILAGAVVAAALVVFILVWFQPQKLVTDDRVNEAAPTVAAESSPTTAVTSAAPPPPPRRGTFVSLDHGTAGSVQVVELADSNRVLRIEGLDTSNGPDLFVYLSTNPADGDEGAFDDDFVNLGRLKGNKGDQNYEVPANVDLSRYASVVIWCDRFNSAFGAADITR